MKKTVFILATALVYCRHFCRGYEFNVRQVAARYTAAIEGRTVDISKVLDLSDTNQAAKVHDIIIGQYRALNAWHQNDAKLKAAKSDTNAIVQVRASLKNGCMMIFFPARGKSVAGADRKNQGQDDLRQGAVHVRRLRRAYRNLSDGNKAEILKLLKQAREEAMDGGSAAEKTAVFTKCKGKINNDLSKQGLHPEKKAATSGTNSPAK